MDKMMNRLRSSFRKKDKDVQIDQKSPTEGNPIKSRALVVWGPAKSPTIEILEIAPPKSGEVRVKIAATGICHSDVHFLRLKDTDNYGYDYKFPAVIGHEGSGVVESIGPDVKSVKPGDHVLLLILPQCLDCDFCKTNQTNMCIGPERMDATCMLDGTTRMTLEGEPIYNFCGCGTLSEYQVMSETRIAKIDKSAPLDKVCLLSCGISTGYGAAVRVAKVKKGSTVGIWGLGTVGLSAAVGARECGASKIIGIDLNKDKFELSKKFGITDLINPNDNPEGLSVDERIRNQTKGLGVDYAFECIGLSNCLADCINSTIPGWGLTISLGIMASDVKFHPKQLMMGKKVTGSLFGGYKGRTDVNHLVDLYMNGKLKILDEFITKKIRLDDAPEAIGSLINGQGLRSVVVFD